MPALAIVTLVAGLLFILATACVIVCSSLGCRSRSWRGWTTIADILAYAVCLPSCATFLYTFARLAGLL